MKTMLILIILAACMGNTRAAGPPLNRQGAVSTDTLPADSLNRFFERQDVSCYYNKAIDSFLLSVPDSPLSVYVSSCKTGKQSMYQACYLQVSYYPDYVLRIYAGQFLHMDPYSPSLNWDAALFRKEKAYRISIYRDNKCISGFCKTAN